MYTGLVNLLDSYYKTHNQQRDLLIIKNILFLVPSFKLFMFIYVAVAISKCVLSTKW